MNTDQFAKVETVCPVCEAGQMVAQWEKTTFEYGAGQNIATLSAYVPIHKCTECGYEYLAEDAMRIRHEEVCRHLGVLTPREIKEVRIRLGMSREAFAGLTGIGSASLARWEAGSLIQNKSHDNLIRFCAYQDNINRAKSWDKLEKKETGFNGRGLDKKAVKTLEPLQNSFSLRKQVCM